MRHLMVFDLQSSEQYPRNSINYLFDYNMKKLSIIGAGQMGLGIAQVAIKIAKIPQVTIYDKISDLQERKLFKSLIKDSKESISSEERERRISSFKITTNLKDLEESDFLIEVIIFFNIKLFLK